MIDPLDIFDIEQEESISTPYTLIGYPRNPFRPEPDIDVLDTGPFYKDHIIRQLRDITQWLREIHRDRTSSQTLSLVGTIGIGKTRLIRFIQRQSYKLAV